MVRKIWCLDNCPRGKMPPVGVRVRFSFRVAGATFLGANCPRTSYTDLNKNMCICVSACKHMWMCLSFCHSVCQSAWNIEVKVIGMERSNHRRCSTEKAVPKNFEIFPGKYLCRSLLPATLLKRDSSTGVSLKIFRNFLKRKNTYFEEHLQTAAFEKNVQVYNLLVSLLLLMKKRSIFINRFNYPPEDYFIIKFDEESWKPKEIAFQMSERIFFSDI